MSSLRRSCGNGNYATVEHSRELLCKVYDGRMEMEIMRLLGTLGRCYVKFTTVVWKWKLCDCWAL